MTASGLTARKAALAALNAVTEERRLLSDVSFPADLSPSDRARAQRLATETLRWANSADRMLGPYLRLRPREPVMNLLRLATVEICAGGAAPHGVVDSAVTLAKSDPAMASHKGLVNAVLRKVAGDAPKWAGLPPPVLPKWLRKALVSAWGKTAVAAMEVAHAAGAPVDLTLKPDAPPPDGQRLPTGSLRLPGSPQISALPGYAEGDWWVQDAAAAIPALALAAQPGARVLDMCAAPGGKTMQLASFGAAVTALDVSERRMERLRENLARTGLSAETVVADALDYEAAPFDAVLLDAPCSATGTIRRHPDLPFAKSAADLAALLPLQAKLIDRAVALTRPGGRVVFCTCSLLPAEGEDQAAAALARHPGLSPDRDALALPGIDPAWIGENGLRLRPDFWAELGGMDGFFIAAFRKSV